MTMMKKFLTLISTAAITFSVMLTPAKAALEIVITEGMDSARPIAVVPFRWKGTGPAPVELTEVVAADLMRSGRFNPIPVTAMPQRPSTASEIDYPRWASLGVEAVLVGTIEPAGVGRYSVTFEIVDVLRGQITGGTQ